MHGGWLTILNRIREMTRSGASQMNAANRVRQRRRVVSLSVATAMRQEAPWFSRWFQLPYHTMVDRVTTGYYHPFPIVVLPLSTLSQCTSGYVGLGINPPLPAWVRVLYYCMVESVIDQNIIDAIIY